MSRKYSVASSRMVPKIVGTLSPGIFRLDRTVWNKIIENARESEVRYVDEASDSGRP